LTKTKLFLVAALNLLLGATSGQQWLVAKMNLPHKRFASMQPFSGLKKNCLMRTVFNWNASVRLVIALSRLHFVL